MSSDDSLLTCGEAAKILNRSTESVRLYERRGELRAIKTAGGLRLFREADVREFALRREHKSTETTA